MFWTFLRRNTAFAIFQTTQGMTATIQKLSMLKPKFSWKVRNSSWSFKKWDTFNLVSHAQNIASGYRITFYMEFGAGERCRCSRKGSHTTSTKILLAWLDWQTLARTSSGTKFLPAFFPSSLSQIMESILIQIPKNIGQDTKTFDTGW